MDNPGIYSRFVKTRLFEALDDTPVVLIHGPRQCGKTTLARQVCDARDYTYFSLDDDAILSGALSDPIGFIDDLPRYSVLDEIQRAPELFRTIKAAVDKDRVPGRFLLTGSANVLLLPNLSDSLAGRLEILRLHPLSQAELVGTPPVFLRMAFENGFKSDTGPRLKRDLAERIAMGGYPAALARSAAGRRAKRYRDCLTTLVQRDVREIVRVKSLDALPRLLALAAGQTGRLINISEMASPFQLSRPTIREYMTLLSHVFLVDELPPWHSNRLSRLIKTPKLHLGDTGLACSLLEIDADTLWADRELLGQLAETFVYQELKRQASWHEYSVTFSHFRNKKGDEVDIILEQKGKLVGIEVKASATVRASDFRDIKTLQSATGARFQSGIVLYDGEHTISFGEQLHAVPLRRLWAAE